MIKFRGPLTWADLTRVVLLRFELTEYDDPSEALTRLRQTTTVAAYHEAFERLSHRVDGLPEAFLISCFIAGLRDDVRLNVKIKHPTSLTEAIGVARLIEERNQLQRRVTPSSRPSSITVPSKATTNPVAWLLGPPPTMRPSVPLNSTPLRRITNQEAKERREKGLCYYCDEKFIPGHRCKSPQLFMIEDFMHQELEEKEDTNQGTENNAPTPEISFHATAGTNHPQTIRVSGKLKNKEVTVLIDGGSTHNFIDQAIVSKHGLPIKK